MKVHIYNAIDTKDDRTFSRWKNPQEQIEKITKLINRGLQNKNEEEGDGVLQK